MQFTPCYKPSYNYLESTTYITALKLNCATSAKILQALIITCRKSLQSHYRKSLLKLTSCTITLFMIISSSQSLVIHTYSRKSIPHFTFRTTTLFTLSIHRSLVVHMYHRKIIIFTSGTITLFIIISSSQSLVVHMYHQ